MAATRQPDTASFRRWPPLLGGGLLNIALGSYYTWSIFVPALEREFGWTRSQTSIVPTINMVMLASMFLVAGLIQRRVGPRVIAFFGGGLFCLGLYSASFIHSLPMLYLTSGVMVGIGLGFGYLVPITVGSKWFPDQRGYVNGLMIGVFAAGSGVFGPLAGRLIGQIGWRSTFQVLAALFSVITMIGAFLLKDPPAGFRHDWQVATGSPRTTQNVDIPAPQVLRLPTFYLLWVAYALGTTAGTMVISQLVPFAQSSGLTTKTAAYALSVGAFGSASGRFFSGWMSDHLGRLLTLRAVIFVSMFATPALFLWSGSLFMFYALLSIVFYCYGTQFTLYPALAGDFYGTKHLATNYGLLLLAWGFAGVVGPVIGSWIFMNTGTYEFAFLGAGALAGAALVCLCLVRAPVHSPEARAQRQLPLSPAKAIPHLHTS
jgi:MFS transporter, OFA family, oxalate/formate antiporter